MGSLGPMAMEGFGSTRLTSFLLSPQSPALNREPYRLFEGHLSYDFNKLHCWASLDGNFWFGGTTSLNGITNPTLGRQVRALERPFRFRWLSISPIKISYSNGTYVRFGGNYQSVSVAWQYSWIGWPKFHAQ